MSIVINDLCLQAFKIIQLILIQIQMIIEIL